MLREVKDRCLGNDTRWHKALSEMGIGIQMAHALMDVAETFPIDTRFQDMDWQAHRELALLMRRDNLTADEAVNRVVVWTQDVENDTARLEGRRPRVIIVPTAREIRGYKRTQKPLSKKYVRVSLTIALELIRILERDGRHDWALILAKEVRKLQGKGMFHENQGQPAKSKRGQEILDTPE